MKREGFDEYIRRVMKQKGLKAVDVERNSGSKIDRSHVSKFMRGSRDEPVGECDDGSGRWVGRESARDLYRRDRLCAGRRQAAPSGRAGVSGFGRKGRGGPGIGGGGTGDGESAAERAHSDDEDC